MMGRDSTKFLSLVLPVPGQGNTDHELPLVSVTEKQGESASWARRYYYVEILNTVTN